jgi:hypothetical protein
VFLIFLVLCDQAAAAVPLRVQFCSVLPVCALACPLSRLRFPFFLVRPAVSRAPLPPCRLRCVRRLLSPAERAVGQSTHARRHGKGRAHCTPFGEVRATTAHPSTRAESTHTAHTTKKRMRQDRARQAGHRLPLKTHKCAWRQIKGCQTL